MIFMYKGLFHSTRLETNTDNCVVFFLLYHSSTFRIQIFMGSKFCWQGILSLCRTKIFTDIVSCGCQSENKILTQNMTKLDQRNLN